MQKNNNNRIGEATIKTNQPIRIGVRLVQQEQHCLEFACVVVVVLEKYQKLPKW